MTKSQLIEAMRKKEGLSVRDAEAVVNMFFGEMSNALARNDRVEIRGLCSFFVKNYKGYTGRNPKTGERTEVKPKKMPFFKCGKELKERVNFQE